MEADLDLVVPMLIKKSSETNGFICDEANKALQSMVHNVSETRAISALASCTSHKHPGARAKAALHLSKTLEVMGAARVLHSRELERVVPIFASLLPEGLSETRSATKSALVMLVREARVQGGETQEKLERLLRRHLNELALRRLLESADQAEPTARGGSVRNLSLSSSSAKGRAGVEGRRGSAMSDMASSEGSSSHSSSAVEGALAVIFASLSAADWLQRKEGIGSLLELVRGGAVEQLGRSGRVMALFDHIVSQLTYANTKVNLAALQALTEMTPHLAELMPPVVATLVPAIASCLTSSNAQVRTVTPNTLATLVANVDGALLIQPFAHNALYANLKARPAMTERLSALSATLHASKPHLVLKHALPVALKLVEENRADMRTSTAQLLQTLYGLVGTVVFEHAQRLPASTQQRLQDIIHAPRRS